MTDATGLDFGALIPRDEIERATEWVSTITGLPSGFFVHNTEAPTGLYGGPPTIYGTHPVLKRLARANAMAERRGHHALWHAALQAMARGVPVSADSVLGPNTVWACPLIVHWEGSLVFEGALAAFLHTPGYMLSASALAEALDVSVDVAFEALEQSLKNALTPQQVTAAETAVTTLCASFRRSIEAALATRTAGSETPTADPGIAVPSDPLIGLHDAVSDWGSVVALLQGTATFLHHTFTVPQVCVWRRLPGSPCSQCAHTDVRCQANQDCLHLLACEGLGSAEDELKRVPLSSVPEGSRSGHVALVLPERVGDLAEPLAGWVSRAGGYALFFTAGGDRFPLALFGLAGDRPLSPAVCHQAERLRWYLSLALLAAETVENARATTHRLQEMALQLTSANQELRRAHRTRNALLTSMSHELRTPLNAVIGLAELMRDGAMGPTTEAQATHLATIESSGRRLLALVQNLLEIANVESGNLQLRPEPCIVARVFAEALHGFQHLAGTRGVTISSTLPADDVVCVTDPQRLRQIVANLVSNAIKYSPPGEKVDVVADVQDDQLVFSVKDRGPEIPSDEAESIFDEFRAGCIGDHADPVGTGLELPLARRLVEALGGRIEVRGRQGGGNEFLVSLPLRPCPTEARPCTTAPFVPTDIKAQSPLAVVLEVDTAIRAMVVQAVCRAGFEPVEVALPEHLGAAVREFRPDVVVVSQALGGYNLYPALRQLREDEETSNVPVVFLGDQELQEQALAIGVSATAGYPLDLDALAELLSRLGPQSPSSASQLALIVDDNPNFADALEIILETAGISVLRARDGVEGLELALRHHPDVILLDLMMPRCDGWTALSRLRNDDATRDIPIIVLTVRPLSADEERGLIKQGAILLPKATFDPTEIWQALEKAGIRVSPGGCGR